MADSAAFIVELAQFSGPLDLLLTLLRDDQIEISEIPIARVAEQFVARIHALGLDEAADYLEMAARLLRIKAQMLLPRRDGEDSWEDPRAELVRRLLEYQQMREVVDVLEQLGDARRNRFARPAEVVLSTPRAALPAGPLSASWIDLLAAVDRILRAAQRPPVHAVIPRVLDVRGAMVTLRVILADRADLTWDDLVAPDAESWQILSVLLAVLELARLSECTVVQDAPFALVRVLRARRPAAAVVADQRPSEAALDPTSVFLLEPSDARSEPVGATV